jgi:hypothetical protein
MLADYSLIERKKHPAKKKYIKLDDFTKIDDLSKKNTITPC